MPRADPREKVFFAFGIVGRTELPAAALVAILGDLGLTAPGARSLLARMERTGALEGIRAGRRVTYRPAGPSRRGFERVRAKGESPGADWDGSYEAVFFSVPETERSYRDDLRRKARNLGFGALRPGVLIHADHGRGDVLTRQVGPPPAGGRVFAGRLEMDLPDARTAAQEAWSLDGLAARYRTFASACLAAVEGASRVGVEDAVAEYARVSLAAHAVLLEGPELPAELLPTDWPHAELAAALRTLHSAYEPALSARLAMLLT